GRLPRRKHTALNHAPPVLMGRRFFVGLPQRTQRAQREKQNDSVLSVPLCVLCVLCVLCGKKGVLMAGPAAIIREIHRLRSHAHDLQTRIDFAPKQLKAQQNAVAKREEELKEAQETIKK